MSKISEMLERHESYRRFIYKDSKGIETIGIGRNLRDRGITRPEALYLLQNDIEDVTKQLRDRLYWFDSIHEDAQMVLIDMTFNCGLDGILTFHNMLEHIKNENYRAAAGELLNSKYATEVGQRAIELANILKSI